MKCGAVHGSLLWRFPNNALQDIQRGEGNFINSHVYDLPFIQGFQKNPCMKGKSKIHTDYGWGDNLSERASGFTLDLRDYMVARFAFGMNNLA